MSARDEAQRLRVIIESLAYTSPAMTMDEAASVIFEIEKRTAALEAPATPAPPRGTKLKDNSPETVAAFINCVPAIYELILDGQLIPALKETRARVADADRPFHPLGLRDSKYAVEYWRDHFRF